MKIRPQVDFPLMEEYKKHFDITEDTIFALGDDIYTDNPLSKDLMVHEMVHLKQQQIMGVKEWVYDFLYNPEQRLKFELEAYREQLKSITDRNRRSFMRKVCAEQLSSALYGNIISMEDAYDLLDIRHKTIYDR